MLPKYISIAAAGLAATTTAFIVLPKPVSTDIDTVNALPFEAPKIAQHQTIKVACPGCPLPARKDRPGKIRVKQGDNSYVDLDLNIDPKMDNHLEFNFSIDHQPKFDRLLVNDFVLYPHVDPFRSRDFTAPQILDLENAGDDEHRRSQRWPVPAILGYNIQWHPTAVDSEGLQLIMIDLKVSQVADAMIDGIPSMRIKLIKTADRGLLIGDITTVEPEPEPEAVEPLEKEKCTTFICAWRTFVADHLKHMRPHKCSKMMGHKGQHHKGQYHKSKRPHHHHRPGAFRLHEHSWTQLFKKFASHILFPIFVGILAGVSASIIGMMVGTVMVGLWRVFVRGQPFFHQRRRHACHAHHKAAQKEAAVAEEKLGLMENQDEDAPPSYEEEESHNNKPANA